MTQLTHNTQVQEILDRTRRIETRLTSYLVRQGEPTFAAKPTWDGVRRCINVPTLDCSIGSCMGVVPGDEQEDVEVYDRRGNLIALITRTFPREPGVV